MRGSDKRPGVRMPILRSGYGRIWRDFGAAGGCATRAGFWLVWHFGVPVVTAGRGNTPSLATIAMQATVEGRRRAAA